MTRILKTMTLALLLLLAGCGDELEVPVFPVEEGDLAMIGRPSALVGDGLVALAWTEVPGGERYHIYRDTGPGSVEVQVGDVQGGDWQDTRVDNLTTYRYRIAGVDASGLEGARSERVSATPALYSVVIAADAAETANSAVMLQLGGPAGTIWMRVAEDDGLPGAVWQPFAGQLPWVLGGGEGSRSVHAEFRDAQDNQSLPVSDAIILDSSARIEGFDFEPSGVLNVEDLVQFAMVTLETGGQARAEIDFLITIPLYDDGVAPDTMAADGIYTGQWIVGSGLDFEDALVWGHFEDHLGNVAVPVLATSTITVQTGNP